MNSAELLVDLIFRYPVLAANKSEILSAAQKLRSAFVTNHKLLVDHVRTYAVENIRNDRPGTIGPCPGHTGRIWSCYRPIPEQLLRSTIKRKSGGGCNVELGLLGMLAATWAIRKREK